MRIFIGIALLTVLSLGWYAAQSFSQQSRLEPRVFDDETVSYLIWDERRYVGSLHDFTGHPEWHVRLNSDTFVWRSYADKRQHEEDYKNLRTAILLPNLSWITQLAEADDEEIASVQFNPGYVPRGKPEFQNNHGTSLLGNHEMMINFMCHLAEEVETGVFRVRNRTPQEIEVSRKNPHFSSDPSFWDKCEAAGDPRLRLQLYRGNMEPAGNGWCKFHDQGECKLSIWYPNNRSVTLKLDRAFLYQFMQLDSMISAVVLASETEDPDDLASE